MKGGWGVVTKGLVLCGGKGTRLRPLTHTRAKQLIPVANKPIVHYVIENLAASGVGDIGVVVSPEAGRDLAADLGDGSRWGVRLTFITQDQPLGLAHAVAVARDFLGESSFVVHLGDCLLSGGTHHLVAGHEREGTDASVLVAPVEDPARFGVAVVDPDDQVIQVVEKASDPPSDLALAGVYVFRPPFNDLVPRVQPSQRGELELTDAIRLLLAGGGRVVARRVRGWWVDTGTLEDLLKANRLALSELGPGRLAGEVTRSRLAGVVVVDEGARVRRSTVRGPAHIGSGALIDSSRIGPYTSVGRGAAVIRGDIEHSIIMDGTLVSDLRRPLNSVLLGQDTVVRGGGDPLQRGAIQMVLGDDSRVNL